MSKDTEMSYKASIHWFRKGLRLHDNPALVQSCQSSKKVYPVFILDPYFARPHIVGVNRYSFLLQCLQDLDDSLRKLGSRLFVVRGNPEIQLPILIERWNITHMTFEGDTEPYAKLRDDTIIKMLRSQSIEVSVHFSHTIFHPEVYLTSSKGSIPTTYQGFQKVFSICGPVRNCEMELSKSSFKTSNTEEELLDHSYDVPSLLELGYSETPTTSFIGGETAALKRLQDYVISRPEWTAKFEKPTTSPNSLDPSTTVLSPYLKFGCLSSTRFYHVLSAITKQYPQSTSPPVSLEGQLLWREFFYFSSYVTPNFDKMEGNARCKQIPWDRDDSKIKAWKDGKTGFPFIDAIMRQLKHEGWIHHLARHSVACFLTRGDLWQHWEEGVKVFDLYLLDADWALNNANWQWLSCSNFFYQYFRCYSPIAFGKKTDPTGAYIKKWIPELSKFPQKYIFEPWRAPLELQKQLNCIIGVDYPNPIVDHEKISKSNMDKMKLAYDTSNTVKRPSSLDENTNSSSKHKKT